MQQCLLHRSMTVADFPCDQGGAEPSPECDGPEGELAMIFANTIAIAKDRIAKRRRYNALVAEIQRLTPRDLADINGSRSEMLYHAYRQVYG
jgi:Domain of unknown function (DUF1127)